MTCIWVEKNILLGVEDYLFTCQTNVSHSFIECTFDVTTLEGLNWNLTNSWKNKIVILLKIITKPKKLEN